MCCLQHIPQRRSVAPPQAHTRRRRVLTGTSPSNCVDTPGVTGVQCCQLIKDPTFSSFANDITIAVTEIHLPARTGQPVGQSTCGAGTRVCVPRRNLVAHCVLCEGSLLCFCVHAARLFHLAVCVCVCLCVRVRACLCVRCSCFGAVSFIVPCWRATCIHCVLPQPQSRNEQHGIASRADV